MSTSGELPSRAPHGRPPRRGQALAEFAIISVVLTLLLSGMIMLGMLLFGTSVIQQAADVGAQELSRMPLWPAIEFGHGPYDLALTGTQTALSTTSVLEQIYDEQFLVVDLTEDLNGQSIDEYFRDKPLINRLLRPVMIVEDVAVETTTAFGGNALDFSGQRRLLRYPGTLITRTDHAHPLTGKLEHTVMVPVVTARDDAGHETIEWRSVVEEITPGRFSLTGTDASQGLVGLRINYPYQSAAMAQFQYTDITGSNRLDLQSALTQTHVQNRYVQADDSSVSASPLPDGYALAEAVNSGIGPFSGAYGLGHSYAGPFIVRPFRKLVAAQGIYRREVFGE